MWKYEKSDKETFNIKKLFAQRGFEQDCSIDLLNQNLCFISNAYIKWHCAQRIYLQFLIGKETPFSEVLLIAVRE